MDNYITTYDPEELESQSFVIDTDQKADWAVEKIKQAKEEMDRVCAICDARIAEFEERSSEAVRRYRADTDHLKYMLSEYMDNVRCEETKTQRTYQLASGKLVMKKGNAEALYEHEDLRQLAIKWAEADPDGGYIRVSPVWRAIKEKLHLDPDTGVVTVAETGEVVDCITCRRKFTELKVE